MPAFVILEHDHPMLHWDLMLDMGEVLRTWRLACLPAVPADIPAESLPDHRREYLMYEGPVSNNRGRVRRVVAGNWTLITNDGGTFTVRLGSIDLKATVSISPECGQGTAAFRH